MNNNTLGSTFNMRDMPPLAPGGQASRRYTDRNAASTSPVVNNNQTPGGQVTGPEANNFDEKFAQSQSANIAGRKLTTATENRYRGDRNAVGPREHLTFSANVEKKSSGAQLTVPLQSEFRLPDQAAETNSMVKVQDQ